MSEFFTGWMDLQGLIFVTNAILKDMCVVRLPASNTALLQNWLFSAENS